MSSATGQRFLLVLLGTCRLEHHRSGSSPDMDRQAVDDAQRHDRSLSTAAARPGKCHRGSSNTTSPYGWREIVWLAYGHAGTRSGGGEMRILRFRDYWTLSSKEKGSYTKKQDKELDISVCEGALFVEKSRERTPNLVTPTYFIKHRSMGVVPATESRRLKRSLVYDFTGPAQGTG